MIDAFLSPACKKFFAKALFVVGEFGGNDYNAPLFAGKGIPEAYKFMPDVIQGISDGIEVELTSIRCVLFNVDCEGKWFRLQLFVCRAGTHC